MSYKHTCFKCGKDFVIEHWIETDKATCQECFEKLLRITAYKDYEKFIK